MNNFNFIMEEGLAPFEEVVEIAASIGLAVLVVVTLVLCGIPAFFIGLIKHRGWDHDIKQVETYDEYYGGTVRHIWCTRCHLNTYERINFSR